MRSIMAASVVLLPEPVAPVTRTMPRSSSASRATTAGRPRSSSAGTETGTDRRTRLIEPRCRKALTRKRPTPGHE